MEAIEEKIIEARYRLNKLYDTSNDKDNFKHEINAFIVSAHSILSIINRKYQKIPGFKKWSSTYNNKILDFFKKQRGASVHIKSIKPTADVILRITEHVLSGTTDSCTEYIWYYEGYDEIDALSLSKKYLDEIKIYIAEVYSNFGKG